MKSTITKTLVTTCFFLSWLSLLNSQNTIKPIEQISINELNISVIEALGKSECQVGGEIKIIHLFYVSYKGDTNKSDFINNEFEQHIEPVFRNSKQKESLVASSLICKEEDGTLFASTDFLSGSYVFCLANYNESAVKIKKSLAKRLLELDVEVIYFFDLTKQGYFVVDKQDNVYFIFCGSDGCQSYLTKDVPYKVWAEYWDLPSF